MSDADDISELLNDLGSFTPPAQPQRAAQDETPLKDEDVQQYFLNKTKALVEAGISAVQDLNHVHFIQTEIHSIWL